ncbi:glycosyltransferase family 4 protein [Salinicoccus sp. ID82-1]|uniref:glycosyltransferase family 4 protein n=1 Tax=Salinicoccus sp. ID82-1 TaxID=2820269 RepID=UPI001F1E543D|nr:glycosyltransferase family 4 protein [Salinicoccus sp. ID82-1]MCG1008451.1 glycosyltransferase family 4 protein [Salinicoccus sp. ID82-1]
MQKKIIHGVTSSMSALFIHEQIHFIEKNGYQVEVVCNNIPKRHYEGLKLAHIPFEREISIHKDVTTLYALYRYLKRKKPDIIVFSTPKAGLLGMIAGYLNGTETRIFAQWGLRLETVTGVKKLILQTTEKLTCLLSTHVIILSDSLEAEMVGRKLVDPKKVVRIGKGSVNGLDMERFSPHVIDQERLTRMKEDLDIKPTDFVIGYMGRITRDKGTNELVEAFMRLSTRHDNVKLLLVGDIESGDPIRPENKKIIETHERILLCAYTKEPEYYYSMMDVFAFPTYREGFGTVSIEAQAMHVPVIGFDSTGVKDTIVDNETGLIVRTNDAKGLEEAIEDMVIHPEKREQMGRNARIFVKENFDRELIQQKVLDFYNTLGRADDKEVAYLKA